ncbi:MAG: hypothetical protein J0I79_19795 [Mesorhizobium sp.]|uniref:hypothetical protein n=1 Tax=Mesorhizobium sp. TaxID=1871066 RepID=UPI001AC08893|nr:hypothetical protein [Mesorhizobium sp.]MBN9220194.1 hypothetical protein [Mesorhizobium sp.]
MAALLVGAVLLSASSLPASAHRTSTGGPTSGIAIPSLTHGQMAVIADYRNRILDVASRQQNTDLTFRRLQNYGNIQYSYCLWGLVPGSLRDEDSPFNECSHAYLSAAQALLVYMRKMDGQKEGVDALISDIDADMVRNHASFVMCQFSGEAFNTADVISPRWRDVPFHAPSLATFAALAIIAAVALRALRGAPRSNRRNGPATPA